MRLDMNERQPQAANKNLRINSLIAPAREHFQAGLRAAQTGFPDQAAKAFEEAAWLDPENAEVQFNLGTAYLSMGLFEQAIVNLSNTVKLKPEMPDAWGNRAVARAALGEDDRSDADLKEAVRRGGNPDGLRAVIEYVKSRRKPQGVPGLVTDRVIERKHDSPLAPSQDVGHERNHSLPLSQDVGQEHDHSLPMSPGEALS
jgi:predicted Zn-dependent protease